MGVNWSVFVRTCTTSFNAAWTLDTSPQTTREPLNRSTKTISTSAALVATSAPMIAASLGVMVRMPSAPRFWQTTPNLVYRSGLGLASWAGDWRKVLCGAHRRGCCGTGGDTRWSGDRFGQRYADGQCGDSQPQTGSVPVALLREELWCQKKNSAWFRNMFPENRSRWPI